MKLRSLSLEPIWRRFPFATADVLALGIVAVGFYLRLGSIRHYWNNADEGIYYQIAHAPSAIAISFIAGNAHPPLYYFLLRAVAGLSDDFVWLRVPALVFGTLSIFALYRLGTRIGGAVCGITAAVLLALSPGAIELSQVARPYALQIFLLIGATSALLGYFQSRRPRLLVGYSIWILLAALTHYGSFLVLAAFGVALGGAAIARQFRARELGDLVIAHVPVLLVCIALYAYHVEPVLLDSAMRREALGSWLGEYFVAGPAELWLNFVGVFGYLTGSTLAGAGSIVFLASVGVCLHRKKLALVGVCVSVVLVAAVASAISVYPFGGTRHSAYLVPFLALIIATATAVVCSMGVRTLVGTALLLAFIAIPRGPASLFIGETTREPVEQPEFEISRAEVDALRERFERLRGTPGLIFMDLSTAYTLLPLIREDALESEWILTDDWRRLRWGERQVVVIPQWYMTVGAEGINAQNHLWSSIRLARTQSSSTALLERDAQLVSANGMALPSSIRALSKNRDERRSVLDDMSRTAHLSVFRLHIPEYQRLLAREVRKRSSERLNAVAGEEPTEIEQYSIAN